jgi:single-stranded-DNA-specific exonuclease
MKWEKQDVSPDLVKSIESKYGCDRLTATILARRGIVLGPEIKFFLENDPRHLRNPFELPGMEEAVERIIAAKEEGEKVLISGDRDVDGICAATLVASFLLSMGIDVSVRLPSGDEPYGLSTQVAEEFAASYGTLIITVDCGISNFEEVKRAAELGVDVIVTDHHNPQEELPPALVIVNPKLSGSAYPFRDLAGCGVAYKLVSALRFALKSELFAQQICLLNTRPVNEAWVIEIAKMRNLVVIDSLTETVIPGRLGISETRLPAFLEGQQILVWDAALQKRTLANIFGGGVEIYMQDISGEIGKEIPSAAGKSLVRIKSLSRMARYQDKETGELDIFISLFTSFIWQREKLFSADDSQELQLACLGTVADIMPLQDENRIIVKQGLKSLAEKPRPGLSDLLFKLKLTSGRRIGAIDISWHLCPAINAAGRMGKPHIALDLLMEKDPVKRDSLTNELLSLNEERKKIGEEIWTLIEPMAEENLKSFGNKLALAHGQTIPRGVTGIMANRLLDRFKVPSLVASLGGSVITASLRSSRGFDLRFLLEPLAGFFLDWGGHDFAAGFSMSVENWEPFLEQLKSRAGLIELDAENGETLKIDAELPHSYLTPDILNLVDCFEPYGEENEPLIFTSRNLKVVEISLMGKPEAKHVKLMLDAGAVKWPAVYWQAVEKVRKDFDLGDQVDVVFRVTRNWYNGKETPQLVISDLKRSGQ